jgi:hypothetical protein
LPNTNKLSISSASHSFDGAPRSLRIIVADDERDTVLTLSMILREERPERLQRIARAGIGARV